MAAETAERVVVEIPVADSDGAIHFESRDLAEFPDQVELMSPISGLRMPLIPERVIRDPVTGHKEVVDTGVSLVFEQGRKRIDRDLLPFVARHSAFTGKGEKTIVFLSSDPRAVSAGSSGPTVVNGAMSSTRGGGDEAAAPLTGWDNLSPTDIRDAIDKGRVVDPMGALSYEFRNPNGRRRERVKKLLWAAANGDDLGDEDVTAPVDEIDADAGAPMPSGERRI